MTKSLMAVNNEEKLDVMRLSTIIFSKLFMDEEYINPNV